MERNDEFPALNRTMKDIALSLKQITRILEAMNTNLVGLYDRLPVLIEETDDDST